MHRLALGLSATTLKLLAIAAMFFDHFVAVFISHDTLIGLILRTPGRIAAPIFCYFIAEGYHHTSNRLRYVQRLVLFALISHIPYILCFGYSFFQATSVMWGLALGLIALTVLKHEKISPPIKIAVLILCCFFSITANWNFVTVLWIVMFGLFYGNFKWQMLSFIGVAMVFHLLPTYIRFGPTHEGYPHVFQIGVILAIPLLAAYNGHIGYKSKNLSRFFYLFYPAHLILIYIIDRFTTFTLM